MSKREMWITSTPLEHHSSLHVLSLANLVGLGRWFSWPLRIQFDFNIKTPLKQHPQADLVFKTIDQDRLAEEKPCFSITELRRWRTEIAPYRTMEEFVKSLARWHRNNYTKSKRVFETYGATVAFYDGDWSAQAEEAYHLYLNVARGYGDRLYDLSFFQEIAKRPDYKLICAWFQGKMIGMFVLQEEPQILHSICCGMDYQHSSKCYFYSWVSYELYRIAIEANKYRLVDVGLTADQSKCQIGYTLIPTRMDLYAKGFFTRNFLRGASKFVNATITSDGRLKLSLKRSAQS